jgi:hypothetical protein
MPTLFLSHLYNYFMATLTIHFNFRDTELTLRGLSFKKLRNTMISQHIIKSDTGRYCIETRFNIDPKTANIKEDYLIKILKGIKKVTPFDKIKTNGHYHLSGEQIMERLTDSDKQ